MDARKLASLSLESERFSYGFVNPGWRAGKQQGRFPWATFRSPRWGLWGKDGIRMQDERSLLGWERAW
jgi:hypothetical protein